MDYNGLHCLERLSETKAVIDHTLLGEKVFDNLLRNQTKYIVKCNKIQSDITLEMRKIVIIWMKEVTEEQKCQQEVFLLAVNYMNRFLNVCQIRRNQLQLLGTACMFIASKLRQSNPLNAATLIFYTDNSITLFELLSFEQLVLSKLKWDIVVVTPLDFLQYITLKIPLESNGISPSQLDERAKSLISYCACDETFWSCCPSLLAGACIAAALVGIFRTRYDGNILRDLLIEISNMIQTYGDVLHEYRDRVERMIERVRRTMSGDQDASDYVAVDSRGYELATPPLPDKSVEIETATTPTDVHHINF